jgi:predicted AAA+ superfamily ATPase
MLLKNYPVEGLVRTPLAAYQKESLLKLFLFDVGLLNHLLNTSYLEIKQQAYEYKGYIAENFVQQELAVPGIEPGYSWSDARAEIEFILTDQQGRLIPLEVKSGKRTRARSLQSYIDKCHPHKTIKLTGTQGSGPEENTHWVMPLYYAGFVLERINS